MSLLDLGSTFFSRLHRKPYKINESTSVFVSISLSSKSYIFLIHYYVCYNVIMIKNMVFISPLRGLRCNNDKRFFSCATIFTTRWSRDKYFFLFWYYVYYSMIKRKKVSFFISSLHLLCYGHRGKKRFLLHLDYGTIMKKYSCFLFHYDVHYAGISLHLPTILTTSLNCRESFLPRKIS